VPIWGPSAITLQTIRAGFPSFGAALAGYVEATRSDDDEKNRLCPPTPYANTMPGWARMTALGTQASMTFGAEPDIRAWANTIELNPVRVPPERSNAPEVVDAQSRLQADAPSGLARLLELAAEQPR
jgi:hypothetical protein